MSKSYSIRVSGIVQGVGFRPMVWRLAHEYGIVGQVCNDSSGVLIQAWASQQSLDKFVQALREQQPPLARIDDIVCSSISTDIETQTPDTFSIVESRGGRINTGVAADAATCPECLAEVMDPVNRRYRYPFTNCTHCGPRLSIVRAIPYDRNNTTMAPFEMCTSCQAEYDNPADRRFHAQPNACADCGPQIWLEDQQGQPVAAANDCDALQTAAGLIRQGFIVAIKGIGGIHLACDAGNTEAVERLRRRKHRYHKAFALMARDIAMVQRFAKVSEYEQSLLCDPAAAIILLQASGEKLSSGIAPGQQSLGFMLPYTPLHHLLMQDLSNPIVLTSGNRSDEPQAIDNNAARQQLAQIADYFLLHDRDIINRLDDSVIRMAAGEPRLLRRARGFAPRPLQIPLIQGAAIDILAMGGELKNTFCLLQGQQAILSQHTGDLENADCWKDYRHSLSRYRQLFDFKPSIIVVDRHPDYLSTRLGKQIAEAQDLPLVEVQHHHAHIASCMAEHGLTQDSGRVLGVALDGLGFGDDGTLWGGEFLAADYRGFQRLSYFQPVALPGGAQAMREPWRNTLAHLLAVFDWEAIEKDYPDLPIVRLLQAKPLATLKTMLRRGLNSPLASSAGRLFDAVAAALGICTESVVYEGQAAIELEALAAPFFRDHPDRRYDFEYRDNILSWKPMWQSLLKDLNAAVEPGVIAARFHGCIASAVSEVAASLCRQHGINTVVLSGGVFQNRLLLERSIDLLQQSGVRVLVPVAAPCNDGGLSLGQVVIALHSDVAIQQRR